MLSYLASEPGGAWGLSLFPMNYDAVVSELLGTEERMIRALLHEKLSFRIHEPVGRLWRRGATTRRPFLAIWFATALLFAVSPLLASGSLSESAILGMLPFAAILAIASVGQMLVIQQGGLDLSVPGAISLSVVVMTSYAHGENGRLLVGIVLALAAVGAAGLISGIAISRFGVTPFVATLGVNALLFGAVLQITKGRSSEDVASGLVHFVTDKTAGIPRTVVFAVAIALAIHFVQSRTIIGRRFVAVGANRAAAQAAGLPVSSYRISTYVAASLCYALAGVLLAGFLGVVSLFPGNDYLLPTIAAVVLSGTSLLGGHGSAVAVAVAALFLVQIQQVVLGLGAPPSVQLIVQGTLIALGMGLRAIPWRLLARRRTRPGLGDPNRLAPTPTPQSWPSVRGKP